MYRITRTTLRGQFENDQCFAVWLKNTPSVHYVTLQDDPTNDGGPNDRRYYIWTQDAPVTTPTCPNSAPDLINESGVNGWNTAAEAAAVVSRIIKRNVSIDEMVKAANDRAMSLDNIIAGAVSDLGKDVKKAVDDAVTSPWSWLALGAIGVGVVVAIKVLK